MMSLMKNAGGHSSRHADARMRPRRKRELVTDSSSNNLEFLRAFADALNDILREERARVHG
jgi:hypothetical protein